MYQSHSQHHDNMYCNTVEMYRISGFGWPDIRRFFNICFRLRQKSCKLPHIWTKYFTYLLLSVAAAILVKFKLVNNKSKAWLKIKQVSTATARPARRSDSCPPCCTQVSTVSVINWWPMTVTCLPHRPPKSTAPETISHSRDMVGAHQNLNGSHNVTMPLSGTVCNAIHGLVLATVNINTKFETSTSTHHKDMIGDTKCRKQGGLR